MKKKIGQQPKAHVGWNLWRAQPAHFYNFPSNSALALDQETQASSTGLGIEVVNIAKSQSDIPQENKTEVENTHTQPFQLRITLNQRARIKKD